MIKFIQKLVILWEKSKFLNLMQMENEYLETMHSDILDRDLNDLREKLGKLRNKKQKTTIGDKNEMLELEREINETEKFKQMIQSGKEKSQDLKRQIKMYKENLWS